MSVMMRQIMMLFDEYQSKENGKHMLRAMTMGLKSIATWLNENNIRTRDGGR